MHGKRQTEPETARDDWHAPEKSVGQDHTHSEWQVVLHRTHSLQVDDINHSSDLNNQSSSVAVVAVARAAPSTVVLYSARLKALKAVRRRELKQTNNDDDNNNISCPNCGFAFAFKDTRTSPDASQSNHHPSTVDADSDYFKILQLVLRNDASRHQLNDADDPDQSPRMAEMDIGSPVAMDYEALPSISSSGDSAAQQAFSGYTDTSNNLSESCFNQGYYDRFFVEIKKLGRGLRGSVFLVQHVLDTIYLGDYAVKSIPIGTSHSWLVRQLQEVHLLEKLRHPNIIHYKHAWIEHKQLTLFGPKVPCLFILMELANGGSLEDFIYLQHIPDLDEAAAPPSKEARSHRLMVLRQRQKAARMGPAAAFNSPESVHARTYGGIGTDVNGRRVRYLTKRQIWALFLDICEGLAHLHRNGIIHRDLKPPNLLLQFASRDRSGDPDEIPRVLISDFGECEDTAHPTPDSAPPHHRTGATGTLEFMSPELLQRDPATGRYTQQQHTRQGDLYSLGVVLYFLCYSCVPFDAALLDDVDALREEILTLAAVRFPVGGHERRVPGTLQRLVERLMDRDPAERPGVEEILEFYRGARARFDDEAAGGEDEEEAGSASERRAERRGLSFTDERE